MKKWPSAYDCQEYKLSHPLFFYHQRKLLKPEVVGFREVSLPEKSQEDDLLKMVFPGQITLYFPSMLLEVVLNRINDTKASMIYTLLPNHWAQIKA